MTTLQDLIDIDDAKVRFSQVKKAFMPYTRKVSIDGCEPQALTVLLNLSLSKPTAKDWLDGKRAQIYFSDPENLVKAEQEIQWFHTHNLKFPDCRVADQRILATPLPSETPTLTSQSLEPSYGWAHNSAVYKHTIWLLNEFYWRGKTETIFNLIREGNELWQALLSDMGLTLGKQLQFKQVIENKLPSSEFPDEVSRYSKQIRFPWHGDYVSLTPVVSHVMQQELCALSRQRDCSLRFKSMIYPNSASIGNLCGSLGGYMNVLNYPIDVKPDQYQTLDASRSRTNRYFDDFQLTSKKTCDVLAHLAGFEQLKSRKAQKHVRQFQLKIIRKQIARWLLPLIELRDNAVTQPIGVDYQPDDPLVTQFLTIKESEFLELTTSLSQRINLALQNNRFASRFAYHPKLMRVLKTELIWVLTQLSRPEPQLPTLQTDTEQYLYLSSMRVFDASAMSCPYLSGALSLTAIWGFIHRYQKELQALLPDGKFLFKDFALFIRQESIQSSAKLTEPSVLAKARQVSPVKRTTIICDDYSDLTFDLVITVEGKQRLSDFQGELKAALPTNLAGGSLFPPDISSEISWLKSYISKSDLFQSVKGLPGYGTWLASHSEQPQSLTKLEEYLAENSSLVPVTNGFHLLESPVERKGSLTKLHAYAENNIALAKCLNPIEVRFGGRDHFFEQAFWSLEVTDQTILIKNRRN
jgi:CRISPR-associated protein Csy2